MNYRESLSDEGLFLCTAVKGDWSSEDISALQRWYQRIGDDRVHQIASINKMLPLVANALVNSCIPTLPQRWSHLLDANQRRVEALVGVLETITTELTSRGCLCAAVEAGGVMLGTRLPKQAYGSGDIDLLVEERHWALVRGIFEDAGFESEDRRDRPTTRIEYYKKSEKSGEQWLEVGFAPFDRMWVPLDYNDRCNLWLSRAMPSEKANGIPVLAPSDALVFVAFHTSLHSYIRAPGLRLQVDVDRLVRDCAIDWDHFVREVLATEIKTRVFVSLAMAKGLLNTPVPDEVLRRLAPSSSRYRAIFRLLARDGVVANGTPKLGKLSSVLLDILISEKSTSAWTLGVAFPSETWLRSHFDRDRSYRGPTWRLHQRRIRALVSRWKPE